MKLRFTALTILGISYFGTNSAIAAPAPAVDVSFTGVVTSSTCALSIQGTSGSLVNLGKVLKRQQGDAVSFSFKVDNDCDISELKGAVFRVSAGNMFSDGIGPASGSATDSRLLLNGVGSLTSDVVSLSNKTVKFNNISTMQTDGFGFTAKLKAGNIAGDFNANVTFDVSYL